MRAPTLKIMDTSLRLFLIPLSAVSIWLTVTAHQENTTYGKLDFSNLLGLKYMVCVSAVCGGYSLAAALSSWLGFWATRAWLFFVSDQVLAYLMVTAGAAVTEIVYLAYKGDQEVTWSEACSSYGGFCGRLKLVLGFHFVGVCCFFILAVISAYTLFSRFPPPFVPSTEAELQDRT